MELMEQTGSRILGPPVAEVRAALAQALGDSMAREHHLREARRLYTEMGATGHARRIAEELGA
jgi:hypothetical protein